jgi:16S rRNA A1518/A1519 N6-dimethyltransferase RsmA/KsgA/DIM1 with predicted DNA glycosylase/AP lyase activity
MQIDKTDYHDLVNELVVLIEKTKIQVVSQANSALTILFWHVGSRILTHNLQHKRAEYGKQIVVTLSRELVERYGRNYEEKNLRRMIQFAEKYSDFENVVTLSRNLS